MDFCKLNAFKYIWRSDHKDKEVQDMEKAKRYLEYWHVLAKLSGNSDDCSFHAYLNDKKIFLKLLILYFFIQEIQCIFVL